MTPYVAGIQPVESGWIKLNTNENPYPPSPNVIESLKSADFSRLRLYPDSDSGILRRAVAENLGLTEDNVFCGNGSDEVLALAFATFFAGKPDILMPDVSYGFYEVWSAMYDAGRMEVPLRGLKVCPEDYKGGKGVVIANPNAPTGNALTLPEVEQIVRSNPDGVVIVDEAYIDFADAESAVGLIGKFDNLLVVRTFSKAYSLAGLRAGFAAGHKYLIDGLRRVKNAFNSYPLDMLAQTAAAAAIRDTAYWDKTRKEITKTRETLRAALDAPPSQANFLFWRPPDAKKMYEYLLENKILVRYWDKPKINGYLRITIGTNEQTEELIRCVKRF